MRQILAIAGLTWKAAFRFRLFLVMAVLLLASVVGLPLIIKDDGTARGFTQILLTYTLSVITVLLGLSTLWLACGTLAGTSRNARYKWWPPSRSPAGRSGWGNGWAWCR